MKRALMLLAFALVIVGTSDEAGACSCAPSGPPKEAFDKAHLVFAGKVNEITGTEFGPKTIRFTVTEAFRGTDAKTIELTSKGGGSAACEFPFRTGQEYLVYAYKLGDSRWATSTCSRTRTIRAASDDLQYLRGR